MWITHCPKYSALLNFWIIFCQVYENKKENLTGCVYTVMSKTDGNKWFTESKNKCVVPQMYPLDLNWAEVNSSRIVHTGPTKELFCSVLVILVKLLIVQHFPGMRKAWLSLGSSPRCLSGECSVEQTELEPGSVSTQTRGSIGEEIQLPLVWSLQCRAEASPAEAEAGGGSGCVCRASTSGHDFWLTF